jgi:hypothetical protein
MHEKGQLNIETGQLLNIWERSSQYWRHINSTLDQVSSYLRQISSIPETSQLNTETGQHLWLVSYRSAQKLYWPAQYLRQVSSALSSRTGQLTNWDKSAQQEERSAQYLWQVSSVLETGQLNICHRSAEFLSKVSSVCVTGPLKTWDMSSQFLWQVNSVLRQPALRNPN